MINGLRAIRQGDILDDRAEALIYSTNILLNCTGGVGGALLQRFGAPFQIELHAMLKARGDRFARQGEVIDFVPAGLPYRHLLHTTPCDALHDTTSEIVADVLTRALQVCAEDSHVKRVAVSALATGYGHFELSEFILVAARVFDDARFAMVEEIVLSIEDAYTFQLASETIQKRSLRLEVVS